MPRDFVGAEASQEWTAINEKQLAALKPEGADGFRTYRQVRRHGMRVMVNTLPVSGEVEAERSARRVERERSEPGALFLLTRKGPREDPGRRQSVGASSTAPLSSGFIPTAKKSLWKDGKLDAGRPANPRPQGGNPGAGLFLTGEYGEVAPVVDKGYAGYTFAIIGRCLPTDPRHFDDRAYAGAKHCKAVHLVGWEKAGPWVVLARRLCGDGGAADGGRPRGVPL